MLFYESKCNGTRLTFAYHKNSILTHSLYIR